MKRRALIVYDGKRYHVRSVYSIRHDLTRAVYECDKPVANDCTSLSAACVAMSDYLTRGRLRVKQRAPASDGKGAEQDGKQDSDEPPLYPVCEYEPEPRDD